MTRLVLTRPHTHAGKQCEPGERIDVDAATADWLVAHDIAMPEQPADGPGAVSEPKSPQRKESKQ